MNICGRHGKRHLYFHTVLAFAVLAVIFTTALTAAGLSGGQTGKPRFEVRLASHEKVEGWENVPGPGPEKAPVWISPEVGLTNGDVALAYPTRTLENKLQYWKAIRKITSISKFRWLSLRRSPAYFCFLSDSFLHKMIFF